MDRPKDEKADKVGPEAAVQTTPRLAELPTGRVEAIIGYARDLADSFCARATEPDENAIGLSLALAGIPRTERKRPPHECGPY
jgi:hypothetical protein